MTKLNTKIRNLFDREQVGMVGLEIEAEGKGLPDDLGYWWKVVAEGSLRAGGCEYVLKKPIQEASVGKALRYLEKSFNKANAQPSWSQRTSVHVHINVQDMSVYDALKFATLYYIFEDVLLSNFKKERVGNNFCLPLKDAMGVIDMIEVALKKDNLPALNPNMWKYGALNLSTIYKFGSLEFRSMEGNLNVGFIEQWVSILLAIKERSRTYATIGDIMGAFSADAALTFTKKTFPKNLLPWIINKQGWEDSVMEGMWRVQSLGYIQKEDKKHQAPERPHQPQKLRKMAFPLGDMVVPAPRAEEVVQVRKQLHEWIVNIEQE